MHTLAHSNPALAKLIVTLDDTPLEVPNPITNCLAELCEWLERTARQSGRVLTSVLVDGTNVEITSPSLKSESFSRIEAKSVSFHSFAAQATNRIFARLAALSDSVEQAIVLVLINQRAFACMTWQNWIVELRSVLIELTFLKELPDSPGCAVSIDDAALMRHVETLHVINALVEVLLADEQCSWEAGPVAAFSTVCEQHLLAWLKRLRQLLEQTNQFSAHHVASN